MAPFLFTMRGATLDTESDIASYEVSEDGVTWRPYDPARDSDERLHSRIVFADPGETKPRKPTPQARV